MNYSKRDATMTRGLAILCMLILHLFCRRGIDVYGEPLIWLNNTTPLVYWFGFFSGICVPLYSLCAGYAQQIIAEKLIQGSQIWKSNLVRAWNLMKNYWAVLFLFSSIGICIAPDGNIPGNIENFIKSIFLLHTYNGSWWYLNTYVLLMLIPTVILMFPVRRIKYHLGILVCIILDMGWYIIGHFGLLPPEPQNIYTAFVYKEIINLIGILPAFWVGAFLCKGKLVKKCDSWLGKHFTLTQRNVLLCGCLFLVFLAYNLLEKSAVVLWVTIVTFLSFNLIYKSETITKIFLFLGQHSTNIWLTHMFFYIYMFPGLVQKAKYPLFMLIFMLVLCIVTSYVINALMLAVEELTKKRKIIK